MIAGFALLAQGEELLAARNLPEAVRCFQQAEAVGVDADRCAARRWMAYMLSGQFECAWLESDAIRRRDTADPHRFWQGEALAGKRVMLRCLHGFGDAVQFLRYVPRLRAIASSLVVEVPPLFVALARCFDGMGQVITWGASAPSPEPQWDVQVEVMELPYLFRTQPSELPLATNYLHLPGVAALQAARSRRLRVGLAWSAGSWNPARSIAPQTLEPLLAVEGCEFWSLASGDEGEQRSDTLRSSLHEEAACRDSIEGLAATISRLDLVITVDTLAAHLAGALGVNAWVLLRHEADWRWMHDRDDSPWYPSLKLFRQRGPDDDWGDSIARVCQALRTRSSIHKGEAG